MQTQEARNDKYDDHDADDVENIHCALRFRLCDFYVKQRFHPLNKHRWRSEVPKTSQQRPLDARKISGEYYTPSCSKTPTRQASRESISVADMKPDINIQAHCDWRLAFNPQGRGQVQTAAEDRRQMIFVIADVGTDRITPAAIQT